MLNIETKELKTNDKLKRKIEMIGRFTNTTPILVICIFEYFFKNYYLFFDNCLIFS